MVTTVAHAKNKQQNFKTHVVDQKIFLVASRVVLFNTRKKDNIIVVFTVGINKL